MLFFLSIQIPTNKMLFFLSIQIPTASCQRRSLQVWMSHLSFSNRNSPHVQSRWQVSDPAKQGTVGGDLNNKNLNSELLLVHYSNHGAGHLNSKLVFKWGSEYQSVNQMLTWILNYHSTGNLNKPLDEQANPHDLNTELVRHSDPQCFMQYLNTGCPRSGFNSIPDF